MTDQNENVCPYCGSERIRAIANIYGYRASCNQCGAVGTNYSDRKTPEWLIADFCHPAHLMQGKTLVDTKMYELTLSMAHKWERICDGEELADVAGEGE